MIKSTRKKMEVADRRREVSRLYMQNKFQPEIAETLGVDQSTISRDLSAIHEEWLSSSIMDFNLAKQVELKRIDNLEREAWDAFEKSKEKKKTVNQKKVKNSARPNQVVEEAAVKTEDREGDARFLGTVQWCITQRCKILGLVDNVQTLQVISAQDRVVGLIKENKISYIQLVQQVGAELANDFFKLAGKVLPKDNVNKEAD